MAANGTGGGNAKSIEAGNAFVRLFTKNGALYKGLADARQQMNTFGRFTAEWGAKLAAVSGGGLVALGAVLSGAVTKATDLADLADKLGTSVEGLSRMNYAFGRAGIGLEELTGHFENFTERVAEFRRTGAGEGAAAFQAMGIAANDLGQDMTENLLKTFDKLGKVADGDRLGLLSKLGGDQFQRLNLAFNRLGPAGFRDAMKRADLVGATVKDEDALRAKRIQAAWNDASLAVKNSVLAVGESLFKYFGGIDVLSNRIIEIAANVRLWVKENGELVLGIGVGLSALAGLGVTLTGFGLTLGAITTAAAGFGTALVAVKAAIVPLLIAAGVGGVGGIFGVWIAGTKTAQEAWKEFVGAIQTTLGPTFGNVQGAFNAIRDSLARGELEGAFRIALAAVQVEWLRFTGFLEQAWLKFTLPLMDAFETIKIELRFVMNQLSAVIEAAGVAAKAVSDPLNMGKYRQEIAAILGEPGMMRDVALAGERSRQMGNANIFGGADAASQKALADAQKQLNFLMLQNAFRKAFNNPNNEVLKPFAKIGEAAAAAATVATRGVRGALVSSQVFGMGEGGSPELRKLADIAAVMKDMREFSATSAIEAEAIKKLQEKQVEVQEEQRDILGDLAEKLPMRFN